MLPSRAIGAAHPRLKKRSFAFRPPLVYISFRAINRREVPPIRWASGKRVQEGGFFYKEASYHHTSVAAPTSDWLSLRYGRSAAVAARRSAPDRVVARIHPASRVRPWACSGCSEPPTPWRENWRTRSRTPGEVDDSLRSGSQLDACRTRTAFTIFTKTYDEEQRDTVFCIVTLILKISVQCSAGCEYFFRSSNLRFIAQQFYSERMKC